MKTKPQVVNRCSWRELVLLAGLVISSLAWAAEQAPLSPEIKARYPAGSIYLSYSALSDFQVHLNDTEKFEGLIKQRKSSARVLAQFRKYLNEEFMREQELSRSTAFLKIDFVSSKVMDKKLSDRRGTVNELTQYWVNADVPELAFFCDAMLRRDEQIESRRLELKSKDTKLKVSWDQIHELKQDPYVRTRQLALYVAEFGTQLKDRSSELDGIAKTDPKTYAEIKKFSNIVATVPDQWTLQRQLAAEIPHAAPAESRARQQALSRDTVFMYELARHRPSDFSHDMALGTLPEGLRRELILRDFRM